MKQGKIYKNSQGRYQLEGDTYYWTCGDYMELYDEEQGEWLTGRVEHGEFDYYWTNDVDTMSLHNGMIARVED